MGLCLVSFAKMLDVRMDLLRGEKGFHGCGVYQHVAIMPSEMFAQHKPVIDFSASQSEH